MGKVKHVLVAPLDWGLGHATRCIPIINELRRRGIVVSIASSGQALTLLRKEFSDLLFFELPSYHPTYSNRIPFLISIFVQVPKFLRAVYQEHRVLQEIVKGNDIHMVVSDNRYGCWSNHIPSFLITHQVNILLPAGLKTLQRMVNYFNHRQVKKFTACWVPDEKQNRLTGDLTIPDDINIKFIGMLSRFEKIEIPFRYDLLVILSGPEPQRTALERIITNQLRGIKMKVKIVRGLPDTIEEMKIDNINVSIGNYSSADELNLLIEESELVICRSGYSSIMDLIKLNKKAIFIPTPGQTEQEYLAVQLKNKQVAYYQSQNEFNLKESLEQSKKYNGFEGWQMTNSLLSEILDQVL
jgi:uncharacterized protein (TIGR00661 family)